MNRTPLVKRTPSRTAGVVFRVPASALVSFVAFAGLVTPGCTPQTLETGYAPRRLGSTEEQRRGYYAGPFSPEARDAGRRPNPAAASDARRPGTF